MFLHVARITERLIANFTAERLESCMRAHVNFQHVFSAVYLAAVLACETFIT